MMKQEINRPHRPASVRHVVVIPVAFAPPVRWSATVSVASGRNAVEARQHQASGLIRRRGSRQARLAERFFSGQPCP
jgi:hypothetical protein